MLRLAGVVEADIVEANDGGLELGGLGELELEQVLLGSLQQLCGARVFVVLVRDLGLVLLMLPGEHLFLLPFSLLLAGTTGLRLLQALLLLLVVLDPLPSLLCLHLLEHGIVSLIDIVPTTKQAVKSRISLSPSHQSLHRSK